jgi:hypothetical protein
MSVQAALDFLQLLSDDAAVKHQLYVAAPDDLRELLNFAKQKSGHLFTVEDLRSALRTHPDPAVVQELTENYGL